MSKTQLLPLKGLFSLSPQKIEIWVLKGSLIISRFTESFQSFTTHFRASRTLQHCLRWPWNPRPLFITRSRGKWVNVPELSGESPSQQKPLLEVTLEKSIHPFKGVRSTARQLFTGQSSLLEKQKGERNIFLPLEKILSCKPFLILRLLSPWSSSLTPGYWKGGSFLTLDFSKSRPWG